MKINIMKITLVSIALCLLLSACSDSTTIVGEASVFGFQNPEVRIDVSGTQYQIVGDKDTKYKNIQKTDSGVILWDLGSRYRVKGTILGNPTNENGIVIQNVTLMKARVIEKLSK